MRMRWFVVLSLVNRIDIMKISDNIVSHSRIGCMLQSLQILQALCLHKIQVLRRILVFLVRPRIEMQVEVRRVVLIIVISRKLVLDLILHPQTNSCLVGPAPGHILDCVAAAAENQQREAPRFDELNTISVAFDCAVVGA